MRLFALYLNVMFAKYLLFYDEYLAQLPNHKNTSNYTGRNYDYERPNDHL